MIAVPNGVLGDYLTETGNSLAITTHWRRDGKPREPTLEGLAVAFPMPSTRIVVLVHGLA